MKDSYGISGIAIRHLMSRAQHEAGYQLDVVGAEIKVNRAFDPIETDASYRERINKTLIELYKELKAQDAAPAALLTGSDPQYTVLDEAHHSDGFAEIKDRLDKLGEKVDQASASLKGLIQTHFRPENEPVNMWRDIKIYEAGTPEAKAAIERSVTETMGAVYTPPEGTSHMDYFREQFMTDPIKTNWPDEKKIRGKCFNEHFEFDTSNLQDVMRVTSEHLQSKRAGMKMAEVVLRSKRKAAAHVYVHSLFSGIDGDAVIEQVNRDFGKGSATASDEEYSLILASIYNLLMKRAQDKAGRDE